MNNKGIYEKYVKRPLDLILAVIALILLSPFLIVVAILVRAKLGSPVLFQQKRPGLQEKIFTLYKFRTMTDARDGNGELLPDSERLTKFGKMLRSTSIDELPELINIIRGDMSFVGPRPLLVEYLPLYNEGQKHRHDVRPGLSGLAQIGGRNTIDWEDKFELDIRYVKAISLTGDFRIVMKTISMIFQRNGISSQTSDTMEKFCGIAQD